MIDGEHQIDDHRASHGTGDEEGRRHEEGQKQHATIEHQLHIAGLPAEPVLQIKRKDAETAEARRMAKQDQERRAHQDAAEQSANQRIGLAVDAAHRPADVVGPVCETGDFFAIDRAVPHLERGDLVLLRGAGAYGMSMASNYNSRPKAAEILVDGGEARVIRRRQTVEDLWRDEL